MTLLHKITRPLTAAALGVSVAVSPIASTPAVAGNEEALIMGAIGTLLLGAIAAEAMNGGQGRIAVQSGTPQGQHWQQGRPPHHQQHWQHGKPPHHHQHQGRPNHGQHSDQGRPPGQTHPGPQSQAAKTLPQRCAINLGGGRHGGIVYGKRCLNNRYAYAYQLPEHCTTHRLTNATGRQRPAYGARCLERFGYQVAQTGRRP